MTEPGASNSDTTKGQQHWHNQGPATVTQLGASNSDTTRAQQQRHNRESAWKWHKQGSATVHNQDKQQHAQPVASNNDATGQRQ